MEKVQELKKMKFDSRLIPKDAEQQFKFGMRCFASYSAASGYLLCEIMGLAEKAFKKSAEAGHPGSQYMMGKFFCSDAERISWWKKSAEQGYIHAQWDLVQFYKEAANKSGNESLKNEAAKWLHIMASSKLDSRALLGLSECYEQGFGVPRHQKKAVNLAALASKVGKFTPSPYSTDGLSKEEMHSIKKHLLKMNTAYKSQEIRTYGEEYLKEQFLDIESESDNDSETYCRPSSPS